MPERARIVGRKAQSRAFCRERIIGRMRRTDLQGTDLRFYREKVRRERAMSPEERLRKMDELIVDLIRLRRQLGTASERKP